jgi:rhodanese-related sulfurtransferase
MSGASSAPKASKAYAGELDAKAAWDRLQADPKAFLVDVRSMAEWNFVGVPDLAELSRSVVLVEWQRFPPEPAPNPGFAAELKEALHDAGHSEGAALYFLCRSGSRSRSAAVAATAAGLGPCFNIHDGFEGSLDAEGHRSQLGGWKAAGLPWIQS